MKLLGLTLETNHFDEYLSFLTEVLELELSSLTDDSMQLLLQGNWVEIRKSTVLSQSRSVHINFQLDPEEYQSLVSKISFFYYRRGQSGFQISSMDTESCSLVDPDGRQWCFSHSLTLPNFDERALISVRNY